MKLREIGTRASGTVCNEHEWGGHNPPIIRPKRVVIGTITGVFTAAPNVVHVQTDAGEHLVIRTDLT